MRVEAVFALNRSEPVYDLTVADAHDFYANGILVGNCMDALRYLVTTASLSGSGSVYEAKGGAPSMSGTYKPSFDAPGYQMTTASAEMMVQHKNPIVAATNSNPAIDRQAIPPNSGGTRVFGPRRPQPLQSRP